MRLELLFDEPITGQSKYGTYWMYTLKDNTGEELIYFAPEEVNEQIKSLRKGDKFEITKLAEQKGSKIEIRYAVKFDENLQKPTLPNRTEVKVQVCDSFYELMLSSCKDAIRIQNELGGMLDAKSLAVTLFIARSKTNGYGSS